MPVIGSKTLPYHAAHANINPANTQSAAQTTLQESSKPITVLSADPPKQLDLKTEIQETRPYQPAEIEEPKEVTPIDALQKAMAADDVKNFDSAKPEIDSPSLLTDGMSNQPSTLQSPDVKEAV